MTTDHAAADGLLMLTGAVAESDAGTSELLRSQPPVAYNGDEQHLSVLVQRELDRMIVGGCDQLVLLKLYPQRGKGAAQAEGALAEDAQSDIGWLAPRVAWPTINASAVRPITIVRLAAEALNFFGPLHGGVITQTAFSDVIVQGRRFTTTYPHINLERYDVYEARTSAPVLGAWRARRLQNQRRETRTNRMIDVALLVLEVSQAAFPRLLG